MGKEDDVAAEEDNCSMFKINPYGVCESYWGDKTPPVILISLDGFRPEYLTRSKPRNATETPFLAAPTIICLAKQGISAPSMMPSYPTMTFPNHYSIVTVT